MTAHALLPDGTLIYTDPESAAIVRLGPGDTDPVPVGAAQGTVVAATADRILTQTDAATYRVWTMDGAQVAVLDGIPGTPAFDGRRVALLQSSCLTTRLQIWDIGSAPPDSLPARCGVPSTTAGTLRHRTAAVGLTCPATEPEGCMGTAGLVAPRAGRARVFAIGPGKRKTFTLASRLSARACRALAHARRWRVAISTPTVYGTGTKTVSVRAPGGATARTAGCSPRR